MTSSFPIRVENSVLSRLLTVFPKLIIINVLEVKIKKDTLDTLPAGTSVVLGMYESDFGAPRLALEKEYQPEIVNMGKEYSPVFKSRNRFQKRMTDVVSVTVRDPDGVSISVPVQFSLNYVEAYHGQGEDMSMIQSIHFNAPIRVMLFAAFKNS